MDGFHRGKYAVLRSLKRPREAEVHRGRAAETERAGEEEPRVRKAKGGRSEASSGKGQAMAGAFAAGGADSTSKTPRGRQTKKGRQCQEEGGGRESQARNARQAESAFPSTSRAS